jgi:hypothetical protein
MVNFTYNRGGLNVEVTIRDESMCKIETFKCRADDFHKIAHILYKKYGIRYKPEISYPLGITKDRDLDWTNQAQNT